jgi:hypothetical protein
MTMRRRCLKASLATLLLFLGQQSQAQPGATPDAKMIPGAPSGSAISSVYSPNLFNGSVNVGVPIYDYSTDFGNFGVSLSYNTSGVKVDEVESPAGLHWNIIAESSVQRIIKDIPDELNIVGPVEVEIVDSGWVTNKSRYIKGKLATYSETPAQQATPNTYRDGECDEFIVSMGGRSFTFNLGKDQYIFTHPHRNVKIQMLLDGVPFTAVTTQDIGTSATTGILEFLITDEQGVQYYFGKGNFEDRTLYNNEYLDDGHMGACKPIVKWVVKKVTFPNGSRITYEYDDSSIGTYHAYTASTCREDYQGNLTWLGNGPVSTQYGNFSRLKLIRYPNNIIVGLNYDVNKLTGAGIPTLDEVYVTSAENCIRYKLEKAKITGRWFLNTVRIYSCDQQQYEPFYSFEYNATPLPDRLSPQQDFFGYYNGETNAATIVASGNSAYPDQQKMSIPQHRPGQSPNYGRTRTANIQFMKAGSLTKVKNAYGGEVSFTYSANNAVPGQLNWLPTDPAFVGNTVYDGLKVDTIRETDAYHPGNNKTSVMTYSGGQSFLTGGYFQAPHYINAGNNNIDSVAFQGQFLTAHQLINGANHGYSNVESKTYADGILMGRRVTTFSNMVDASSGFYPRYYKVPGSKDYTQYPYTDKQYVKDWEIGQILTVTDYDRNNRILQDVTNTYDIKPDVDHSAQAYISNTKTTKINTGSQVFIGIPGTGRYYYPNKKIFTDTYYPYTGTANLIKTVTRKYVSDTRFVIDSAVYSYDQRNNLKRVITLDSRGSKIATDNVYNYHVDGPDVTSTQVGNVLYNMTVAGLEKLVSTQRWLLGTGGTAPFNDKLLDASISGQFQEPGKLLIRYLYTLKAEAPLGYTEYTGFSMGSPSSVSPYQRVRDAFSGLTVPYMQKVSEVISYDAKGNPLETLIGETGQYTASLWDSTRGQAIATVIGGRYTDIACSSFEQNEPGPGGTLSVTRGNISYDLTHITDAAPEQTASGKYAFRLSAGVGAQLVNGSQNLAQGKKYTLSFWALGPVPAVAIGSTTLTVPPAVYERGSWKQYRVSFTPTGTTDKFKISWPGSGIVYLDEVRLHPAEASMESSTYTPVFGMSSSTDQNGRITYYGYDKMGRRVQVKDQDLNIRSQTRYLMPQ